MTLPQGATPKSLAGSFDSPDRLVAQKNAAGSCPPVVMHGNDEREREEDSNRATEAGFVAAREAFARLAEAQERARNTSWGNVALPAGWGWPDRQSRPAASAPTTGVGDAWAASDRAAKLASNSMVSDGLCTLTMTRQMGILYLNTAPYSLSMKNHLGHTLKLCMCVRLALFRDGKQRKAIRDGSGSRFVVDLCVVEKLEGRSNPGTRAMLVYSMKG